MRPEEATEYELDAQQKLNKASEDELIIKMRFATTDAERLKIATDIANLETQMEDTEKRRLTLMESEAIKKMDVATLITIGTSEGGDSDAKGTRRPVRESSAECRQCFHRFDQTE